MRTLAGAGWNTTPKRTKKTTKKEMKTDKEDKCRSRKKTRYRQGGLWTFAWGKKGGGREGPLEGKFGLGDARSFETRRDTKLLV